MLKNKIWFGIILSILLLIFSVTGFTAYYKYTQESGANFYVGAGDKADALEDTNEVRQILDDLGNLLGHSKRDDLYPKDETTGGYLGRLNSGLDASKPAAPTVNDMYLATDTTKVYKCFVAENWVQVYPGAGGATTFLELTDTPANYTDQAGKYTKVNVGETALEFGTPSGGYTNLTSFVDQTAWRVFYSNNLGDVIELALGTDGQYLKSTGATSAPIFDTPGGAGDMLKATYDSDEDSDIDVVAGGTEKSSWTLYCIPYLSGTTAFGEIPIGTAEYALTVNAGANGYDWTLFLEDLIDDTTPEYGGTMDHNNERDTEVKTIEFNGLYDCGNSGATPTVNWQNGNYQKIAISENALLTFSNAFIGTITLVMTYGGNYTLGFNAGYTILEEGGTELSFTETSAAVDILKVMYLGTANNYVVGVMLDVKD